MQKFSTWMILMLAIIFWLLRIVAAYCSQMGMEFMAQPLDFGLEIFVIFTAILCFVLIAKRKWLGTILYLVAYEGYFGADIINNFKNITEGTLSANQYMNIFFSFIGMVLPIIVLFDMLLDKNRELNPTDKKTDWFYKEKKFDRNMDERADKNNYRTL